MLVSRRFRRTGLTLLALAVTWLVAGGALAQGPPVEIAKGKFETASQRNAMKAFRQTGGPKTDAEAKGLADKLFKHAGLGRAPGLEEDGDGHLMEVNKADPSSHFRIDKKTGDFSFNKGMKTYLNDQATENLPRGDKAVEVARKHLRDLGLLPANEKEMVVRHVGGLRQVDIGPDGKAVERDKLVTVHFGRQIDGVDVGGPGSKIVVQLGKNGELVGLHRRWVEVAPEKKGPDDFAAEADVRARIKDRLQHDAAKAKRIASGAPDFGYFDDGAGNIEPAYFYDAELTYDLTDQEDTSKAREKKEKYHGAVPALRRSKAKFNQLDKAEKQPGKNREGNKDSAPVKGG